MKTFILITIFLAIFIVLFPSRKQECYEYAWNNGELSGIKVKICQYKFWWQGYIK